MILRCESDGLIGETGVHDQVRLLLKPLIHRELAPSNRPGGSVRQSLREFPGLGQHLTRGYGVIHQADPGRIGTGQPPSAILVNRDLNGGSLISTALGFNLGFVIGF